MRQTELKSRSAAAKACLHTPSGVLARAAYRARARAALAVRMRPVQRAGGPARGRRADEIRWALRAPLRGSADKAEIHLQQSPRHTDRHSRLGGHGAARHADERRKPEAEKQSRLPTSRRCSCCGRVVLYCRGCAFKMCSRVVWRRRYDGCRKITAASLARRRGAGCGAPAPGPGSAAPRHTAAGAPPWLDCTGGGGGGGANCQRRPPRRRLSTKRTGSPQSDSRSRTSLLTPTQAMRGWGPLGHASRTSSLERVGDELTP